MASLFDNLPGGNNPAKMLQKEIEGMELKKQSLITAVQNEIQAANQKINGKMYDIGGEVYQGHVDGADIAEIKEKLNGHFDEITALKSLIEEKEAKIEAIAARYDDELGLLRTQLNVTQPQPARGAAAPSGGSAACANCGKPYAPGVDKFCMGCGQKLDAAPPQSAPTGDENTGAACGNCGRPYTPGVDKFCMGCGQKLG